MWDLEASPYCGDKGAVTVLLDKLVDVKLSAGRSLATKELDGQIFSMRISQATLAAVKQHGYNGT